MSERGRTMECVGWPDQPCAWGECLAANACQNHGGSGGADVALDPTGRFGVTVQGAWIETVEVVDE